MDIEFKSEIVGVVWGLSGNSASVAGIIKMNGIVIFYSEMSIWNLNNFDFENLDEKEWTDKLIRDFATTLGKLNRPNMGF